MNGATTCFRNRRTPTGVCPGSANGARVYDPQQRHLQPPRQSPGNRHSVTEPEPRSGASGERRHISFLNRSCSPIRVTYPQARKSYIVCPTPHLCFIAADHRPVSICGQNPLGHLNHSFNRIYPFAVKNYPQKINNYPDYPNYPRFLDQTKMEETYENNATTFNYWKNNVICGD